MGTIFSRRNIIEASAAGLVASLASRPVAASILPSQPQIDPRLREKALLALEANRSRLRHTDIIGIADFGRASREQRFFLLDVASGFVTGHLVAHGRGSDPSHVGWLQLFSNLHGSEATSQGAYITGEAYTGKYGYSRKLRGLDPTNNNAEARAIVIHSAWYAEPNVIEQHGKLGRSEGCFALPGVSHAEIMYRLGEGRLLYADKV